MKRATPDVTFVISADQAELVPDLLPRYSLVDGVIHSPLQMDEVLQTLTELGVCSTDSDIVEERQQPDRHDETTAY
ncbi:MAG: hypothetical protein R3C28_03755 [Pirellulaceae bacterium]